MRLALGMGMVVVPLLLTCCSDIRVLGSSEFQEEESDDDDVMMQ